MKKNQGSASHLEMKHLKWVCGADAPQRARSRWEARAHQRPPEVIAFPQPPRPLRRSPAAGPFPCHSPPSHPSEGGGGGMEGKGRRRESTGAARPRRRAVCAAVAVTLRALPSAGGTEGAGKCVLLSCRTTYMISVLYTFPLFLTSCFIN